MRDMDIKKKLEKLVDSMVQITTGIKVETELTYGKGKGKTSSETESGKGMGAFGERKL